MLFFFFDATHPKGPSDDLFLFAFHRERSANSEKKKKKLLRSQVGYDQLLHFIPDLSGDLKLLRFVVLIE